MSAADARAPARAPRAAALGLAALVAAAIGWACVAEIDVVASAEGRVIPAARTKRIQPLEPGIVRAIRVDDGQRVRTGEVLVELDPDLRAADRDRLANNLLRTQADAARLAAMATPARGFAPPDGLDADSRGRHAALLEAELGEHAARLAGLDEEIRRGGARARAIRAAIERQRRVLPLLRERAEARRTLAERGSGSRLAWLEIEQQAIEREQELAEQIARLDETLAEIAATRAQRVRVDAEFRRSVHARAIEAERLAVSLAQELAKAERHLAWQTLTAPIDGTVQQLAIHTVGGVVSAAETLMLVVPEDDELEIEALVLNRDIGFVAPGQAAQVKFETFPYTIHGTLPATLRDVGRDAIEDPRFGLVYPTRVRLSAQTMVVDGRRVKLAAGMRATVDVVTDRRRAIEFLLSPVLRLANESWRER